jgi:hypothetical protein
MNRQYSAEDSPSLDEEEGEYDDGEQQDNEDENVVEDEDEETEMDQDDEETAPRVLSQEQIQKRNEAYGTIPRSQSELDLRQAAMTPPPPGGGTKKRKNSLLSVKEENEDEPSPSKQQQRNDGKPKSFSARKMSLADMGLTTFNYPTQFDEVDGEDEEDENGDEPGAFKRPKSAFALAKTDLTSREWQAEIEGLEAVVRLIKWHRVIIDKTG